MKLSYQYNLSIGKNKKKWFISRKQSYHGSTSDTLSLGDRPNLKIYENFFPKYRSKINEHNIFRQEKKMRQRKNTRKDQRMSLKKKS